MPRLLGEMTNRRPKTANGRFQFSLRGLICLTTVLAVCFALVAWKGILWGAVFILLAAVGWGVSHYRSGIASVHPILWILAIYSAGSYLLLCVFVNPPFTTIGSYDETKLNTEMTDWLALALIAWFFGTGLVAVITKNPFIGKWVSISVAFGVPFGILLLTGVCFWNGTAAEDSAIRSFWFGRGVGTLGVGWVFLFALFYHLSKVQPAKRGQNVEAQDMETPRD